MSKSEKTEVSTAWLVAVVKLLSVMAQDGVEMEGCEDPADLISNFADDIDIGDEDDRWEAAILKLAGMEG